MSNRVGPLQAHQNLLDLDSAATARTNLGLGTAATKAASSSGATVASVSGSFTIGNLAVFADTNGTVQDGGSPSAAGSGTISGVVAGTGLSGGGSSGSVTVSFASIANNDVLANISGSAAAPSATTVSALLDAALGSTRGSLIYRGASGWTVLTPGTSAYVLTSNGPGADPAWTASSGQLPVYAPASVSGSNGTAVSITSGQATGSGFSGGSITLQAGPSSLANGGTALLAGGDATSGLSGGSLTVRGGNGLAGGAVTVQGGTGSNSAGGAVTVAGGDGSGSTATSGGSLTLRGGDSGDGAHATGAINISTKDTAGPLVPGSINITAGSNTSSTAFNKAGAGINLTTGSGGATNSNGGDLTITPGAKAGTGRNGLIIVTSIPTADPHVVGALWNNSGVVNISAG